MSTTRKMLLSLMRMSRRIHLLLPTECPPPTPTYEKVAKVSAEDVDAEKLVDRNKKCVEKVEDNAELCRCQNIIESAEDLGLNVDTGVGVDVEKITGGNVTCVEKVRDEFHEPEKRRGTRFDSTCPLYNGHQVQIGTFWTLVHFPQDGTGSHPTLQMDLDGTLIE